MTTSTPTPAAVLPATEPEQAVETPRIALRDVSRLTWREFVLGVRAGTVELPPHWSYPADRITAREAPRRRNNRGGPLVQPVYGRAPLTDDFLRANLGRYFVRLDPDGTITVKDYFVPGETVCHWDPASAWVVQGPPRQVDPNQPQERWLFTDCVADFPSYAETLDAGPDDMLILYHDSTVLPPEPGVAEGYAIGPFYIAIFGFHGHSSYSGSQTCISWMATRTPDAPPTLDAQYRETYNCHPNIGLTVCYGHGDTGTMIDALAHERDWVSVLFVIDRFLNNWNPRDTAISGHPRGLAWDRPKWEGPQVITEDDISPPQRCLDCGERLPRDGHGSFVGVRAAGGWFCNRCYEQRYTRCHSCRGTTLREQRYVHEGHQYCRYCYPGQGVYFNCRACGREQDREGGRDTERRYCNRCYSYRFFQCGMCHRWRSNRGQYHRYEGLCNDCHAEQAYRCRLCGMYNTPAEGDDHAHRLCRTCVQFGWFACAECLRITERSETPDPEHRLCGRCWDTRQAQRAQAQQQAQTELPVTLDAAQRAAADLAALRADVLGIVNALDTTAQEPAEGVTWTYER